MDTDPLPLQEEITSCIAGKYCISDVDLQKALYQRYLARKDRQKPTTVTHRGQEWFEVVPIGATGSFSHML